MKSKDVGKHRKDRNPFADLLERSFSKQRELKAGDYFYGTVTESRSNRDFIFVNVGEITGIIDRAELLDENGNLAVNGGEKLHLFFLRMDNGEYHFTTKCTGKEARAVLQSALDNQVPLKGEIIRKVKGGYEIRIGDAIAFCPGSHLDDEQAGQKRLHFIVMDMENNRIIVSHRIYRETLREAEKERLRKSLNLGDIVTGFVKSLHDFGAFIDIGGVEGLIPLSELSFNRVNHPSEVLSPGQEVRAQVLGIDWKDDKISLSYRALLANPWQGKLPFQEGEIVEGNVESIKNFGVFIKLDEQFTGLIPNSETGVPRGQSLEKAFHPGNKVRVMVQKIDRENRRISLSAAKVKDEETRKDYEEYLNANRKKDASDPDISSFGKALLASLEKKKSSVEKKRD